MNDHIDTIARIVRIVAIWFTLAVAGWQADSFAQVLVMAFLISVALVANDEVNS